MNFIGIDPGKGGAIAVRYEWSVLKLKDATERDVWEFLAGEIAAGGPWFAVIEAVHSSPQMGVVSAFSFGRSLGFLRGVLTAVSIPFAEVTPQKWQKLLECRTGGDKNVSKARAQQLWPGEKITHATADAMLLAEYARRVYSV